MLQARFPPFFFRMLRSCMVASESSYSDDDALHPQVFLCSNCTRPQKQSWRLGCTFQRDRHGKGQIDSHLIRNVLFHLRHQMVYSSELLGDVRPIKLVIPHRFQPLKTDPPPIHHSRHNPQEELLHIVQQHQKLLSKCVHESIVHGTICKHVFLVTSPAFHTEALRNNPTYCVL